MMSRSLLFILIISLAAAPFATLKAASDTSPSKDSKTPAQAAPAKAADPEAYTLDAWDFQDPAKFKSMIKDREDLMLKMYNLRIKLINEDPELLKLHKQIMELHKELAMQLESKKEMKKLAEKMKDLDSDLDKLPRKDSK